VTHDHFNRALGVKATCNIYSSPVQGFLLGERLSWNRFCYPIDSDPCKYILPFSGLLKIR